MNDISDLAASAVSAASIGNLLQKKKLLVTTAESCTGGGIAYAITSVAGSSAWFDRGFVTYSNASKIELLGVPEELIDRYGAVSEEVAAAMAQGALAHSHAHIALSTTGIAGPGGAVPGKPTGTVCWGWAVKCNGLIERVDTERLILSGDREAVRQQTVLHALNGLLRILETCAE